MARDGERMLYRKKDSAKGMLFFKFIYKMADDSIEINKI